MNQFQPYPNQFGMYGRQYPLQNTGITWVQGIEGAKAWQLAPNSNVLLMDSEMDGRFYIKTSDNIGMCSMRTFEYHEVLDEPTKQKMDLSEYVRKDELRDLILGIKNERVVYEQSISTNEPAANR